MNKPPTHRFYAYTDGASSGNPGPAGWGTVLVLGDQVIELGGGEARATNNRMELLSCLNAIATWRQSSSGEWKHSNLQIRTDSTYLIQGMTQWGHGWSRKGWPADLANRELWMQLWEVRENVTFQHVRGHSGVLGNERADQIAVAYSLKKPIELYRGALSEYPHLSRGPHKPESDGTALYLSLVDGVVGRHATWAECEAHVKGRSGARFQKVRSYAEEAAVLEKWGVNSST